MSIETRDFRNVVSGKIERNDPETFLGKEVDVYYRYNWALGIMLQRSSDQQLRVLELGCGLGWFGRVLEQHFGDQVRYVGVDLDQAAIEEASRRSAGGKGLEYKQGDICRLEDLNLQANSFDFVIWFENLEHVRPANFLDLVDTVRGFLKPGGQLLVEVPNRIGGGGLRASGPLRKSSSRYSRGQHNPHHYFEPTLEEARFLFPGASIEGFEPGEQLLALKGVARGLANLIHGLFRPACHIERGGMIRDQDLAYLAMYRRLPRWNRAFLIREVMP